MQVGCKLDACATASFEKRVLLVEPRLQNEDKSLLMTFVVVKQLHVRCSLKYMATWAKREVCAFDG
jgi:hypothetical protein